MMLGMKQVTAETITDEQIRELKFSSTGEERHQACLALGLYGTAFQFRRARARCAEILNARGGAGA
jgi:hypothetical protein